LKSSHAVCQQSVFSNIKLISQAINLTGIAIGPATNFLLANANFHILGPFFFNRYTGAGYLMVCLHIMNFFLTLVFFSDPPKVRDGLGLKIEDEAADVEGVGVCARLGLGIRTAVGIEGGAGVMVICGLGMLWLSLLETLVAPIARASFGWSLQRISIFFAVFALVAAILMVIVGLCSKCLKDRSLIAASVACYSVSIFIFFFWMPTVDQVGFPAFAIAGTFITLGFTCQNAPSMALFTKLMSGTEYEGLTSDSLHHLG